MKLHPSVWLDNEPVLVVNPALGTMRVAGINEQIAWITDGTTVPMEPEDPTSQASVQVTVKKAIAAISSRYLTGVVRPRRGETPVFLSFFVDASGLPSRGSSSAVTNAAASELLTLLAKLHGRWPEVAAEIEQGRARLGLPPLGQDMA